MKEPFLSAIPVLKRLEDAGYEAFFVGGSVRDYLLHKPISDVDIATSATPDEVKTIFSKTVDIGIEHGTVLVLYGQKSYEVTTFRSEGEYQDFRRPKQVSFIRSLTEDLKRRDFTINAMAMDRTGKLIDPYQGQLAIKEKRIQTVGQARDRFSEDALRMMRAVRFVSQLSFHIAENTMTALKELAPLLEKIAIERKKAEFEKMLVGQNWKEAIEIMLETNLFSFLPGLPNRKQQLATMMNYDCAGFKKTEMWSLLVYCLQLSEHGTELFLRDWRLSVKEINDIKRILGYLKKRLQQEWSVFDLYKAGSAAAIESVEKLYLAISGQNETNTIPPLLDYYQSLPIKDSKDLAVTGNDLMEWFQESGGPWIKEKLVSIEKAILAGKVVNEKRKIKEWLMACSQN